MWGDLKTHVKTVLEGSGDIEAAAIYTYRKSTFDKYPAITVVAQEGNGEFADTQRNRRTYTLSIKCYQERVEREESEAERILTTLTDGIITLFDNNIYLDGDWLKGRGFVMPIPSRWELIQGEQIDVLMAEVLLQAVVIE